MKIGMALHITKETGILVRTLRAGGALVAITGCNPLSTQDDVAAALATEEGVLVLVTKVNQRRLLQILNVIASNRISQSTTVAI